MGIREFRAAALATLERLRATLLREPTDAEVAKAMGIHPSNISRRLGKDATWRRAKATATCVPRAVNREGEGVGLAEDDRDERKSNAIGEVFLDPQVPKPKRVSAKRRED
jgi:Tat protein secretion system quality control protein TatD with DNase activity